MYNFLEFIDSSDIREYNQNTIFTPAQQAVLISSTSNNKFLIYWRRMIVSYARRRNEA